MTIEKQNIVKVKFHAYGIMLGIIDKEDMKLIEESKRV